MGKSCCVVANLAAFVGRILVSLVFLLSGYHVFMNYHEILAQMGTLQVPYADIAVPILVVVNLLGGLLVLLGWYTRFGAFLLFLLCVGYTYYFHPYWAVQGGEMVQHLIHFVKNVGLIGALFYLMAFGAGKISIDGLFRKKCCHSGS